ncbi:response regulator transcription factor [Nonomuraea sp. NN258]|nr:response regulator transcription factor [Nonomuraea antri]
MVRRRRGARPAHRIDVGRLPEDVVALIDALQPGEHLVVTRDGASIATIAGTVDVVHGTVVERAAPEEEERDRPPTDHSGVTVVATAMELSAAARLALSDRLGADYVVLDLHAAPVTADVLLVPPGSPQLIGALRAAFPQARVVVTEIEDDELGVRYHGPVRRLLDAGADAYLPPVSVPQLARQLEHTLNQGRELAAGAPPLQIAPP